MSFYTSLNGMKNAQTSLGVISHNIANSETYGFKRSRTEFSEIVAGSALTNPRMIQGIGASVESITQNFALGPVEQTAPRSISRSRATASSPRARPATVRRFTRAPDLSR